MRAPLFIALGAGNMFLAVAAGAFGAHALKATLSAQMLAVWHTAVNYHMVHALGLLAIGLMMSLLHTSKTALPTSGKPVLLVRAGSAMLVGIVLFSGSLYALALTGIRLLGAITPFGGLAFLVAWALLAWAAWKMLD
jgi:uncharacterized membrane protein YgdD (TMEM256/DUF423 family)